MKRVLSIFVLCLLLASCKSNSEVENDSYSISVIAPGVYDGVRAYLKTVDNKRNEIVQDSAIIFNEKFIFEGQTDGPQLWQLTINGVNGSLALVIENKDFSISVNPDDLTKSTISGSKSNDALIAYTTHSRELTHKRFDLIRKNNEVVIYDDPSEKSDLATQIRDINQELADYPFDFLSAHSDNYFSLLLLESLIAAPNADLEAIESKYKAFKSDIKMSDYGQRVAEQLEVKKLEMAKFGALNIGNKAPDFSAPDPDGNSISLDDIKGKVTIIDFWASWCGPCRKENPNVVKIYQKYHEKGLEIINVSLDRPGNKDKWLKAIEDDKLAWHHVSNLNYFHDPVAKLYNIRSIPATYILDESGTIVAKNLRGAALEAKIGELLN